MTADVVIPTWEARDLVLSCLEALERDPTGGRPIVVDNGSGDGTVEAVRERFPGATVVPLQANAGFGRAVNAGVRAGTAEAIVLINNDVLVEPGFVGAITSPLAQDQVGMVAGLTLIPGTGLVDGFGIELDRALAAYNRGRRGPVGARLGRLAMPSGGAAAYRRAAFEAAGGFDDAFFAYGEDVDLGLRLRAAGWAVAGAADARAAHLGGASAGVGSPLQRRLAGFARGFLLRRYGVLRSRGAPRALAIEAAVIAWGLLRHGTIVPARSRIEGWRAARTGDRHPIPAGVIDEAIGAREAFRRLRESR